MTSEELRNLARNTAMWSALLWPLFFVGWLVAAWIYLLAAARFDLESAPRERLAEARLRHTTHMAVQWGVGVGLVLVALAGVAGVLDGVLAAAAALSCVSLSAGAGVVGLATVWRLRREQGDVDLSERRALVAQIGLAVSCAVLAGVGALSLQFAA